MRICFDGDADGDDDDEDDDDDDRWLMTDDDDDEDDDDAGWWRRRATRNKTSDEWRGCLMTMRTTTFVNKNAS